MVAGREDETRMRKAKAEMKLIFRRKIYVLTSRSRMMSIHKITRNSRKSFVPTAAKLRDKEKVKEGR
jgi:hypothetical protein